MSPTVEINQGEVVIDFKSPSTGKLSFTELGIKNDDLFFKGGLLRMVFDFEGIGKHHYYKIPTIEVTYQEEMDETHWQLDFNDETILDKTNHHGHSTIILFNRNKLIELEHHHQNKLILHAEFSQAVHLIADKSFINFFS